MGVALLGPLAPSAVAAKPHGGPLALNPALDPIALLAPTGEPPEERLFGYSVAESADGRTALVGAPNDGTGIGAAWVFAHTNSGWVVQAKLTSGALASGMCSAPTSGEGEDCGFGYSVALSADGNTALVGSPRSLTEPESKEQSGAAFVFTRAGETWTPTAELTGGAEEIGDGHFGRSVALSGDGTTALVGSSFDAFGHGAAWVFTRSGSEWSRQGPKLTAGAETGESFFGTSVALSGSGDVAVIGAPGVEGGSGRYTGAAFVFARSEGVWSPQLSRLTGGAEEAGEGHVGSSVALSADGSTALVGARSDSERKGAAWVFTQGEDSWERQGPKLTAGGEEGLGLFGYSVALSATGSTALIGGPGDAHGSGAAWAFKRAGASWAEAGKVGGGETMFRWLGASVALTAAGANGLMGAPRSGEHEGSAVTLTGIYPPTVTSVTPTSGSSAGGTEITVRGIRFLPGARVIVGSEATAVHVISETELTATTSATAAGTDEVVVQDEYGTSIGGPTFTYETPATPETSIFTTVSTMSGIGKVEVAGSKTPIPVLGVSGNLLPVSGKVYVRLPGSKRFVLVTGLLNVPVGTIIDARHGKVTLTTMGPHGLQTMTFYEGEFIFTQAKTGLVVAILYGGKFSVCPTARERAHRAQASSRHASRKHVVRKLWANGHGSYSTKGNYATGAVLGTIWLTEDRCDGTLFKVVKDRVAVTNLVNHRHVHVNAGHTYLAKAP